MPPPQTFLTWMPPIFFTQLLSGVFWPPSEDSVSEPSLSSGLPSLRSEDTEGSGGGNNCSYYSTAGYTPGTVLTPQQPGEALASSTGLNSEKQLGKTTQL